MTNTEIINEFKDIKGINEAKKIYKLLAKKLHPDIGGTNELFKNLNKIYNDILENKIFFSNESKIDLELEKIISQILHFENIVIEIIGSWIWINGDTKIIKDNLKGLGFKWARNKKLWFYGEMKKRNNVEQNIDDIKAKYGCQTINKKEYKKITKD